jgi:hypothetical protein
MTSISFKDIEAFTVGQLFYECESGDNYECVVTTVPVVTVADWDDGDKRQARFKAINAQNGVEIDYLATEGLMHYGPRLYTEPQYVRIVGGVAQVRFVGELDAGTEVRLKRQPVATGIFVSASKGEWQVLWDDTNHIYKVSVLDVEVHPNI